MDSAAERRMLLDHIVVRLGDQSVPDKAVISATPGQDVEQVVNLTSLSGLQAAMDR